VRVSLTAWHSCTRLCLCACVSVSQSVSPRSPLSGEAFGPSPGEGALVVVATRARLHRRLCTMHAYLIVRDRACKPGYTPEKTRTCNLHQTHMCTRTYTHTARRQWTTSVLSVNRHRGRGGERQTQLSQNLHTLYAHTRACTHAHTHTMEPVGE
jgi:hypothetical protein